MGFLSQPLRRRTDASSRTVLLIVCAGVVLASLDLFIVNVALPGAARDLHTRDLADLSWVLNAYAIVYAALLVLFGRLAESRRRDRGFLIGVFTAASAACGAADSLTMLVAFRVVQAAGAALLTPTSLSLVLATSPPERRHSSVRAWTAVGGLAAALGPVVGGLLVAASWRWVFLVNVPIGISALVIGWRRLPEVPGQPGRRADPLAALLVTGGVAALTLGLVDGQRWGWGSVATVAALAASVFALGLFAWHCARHSNPLIPADLFRVRAFSGSSAVSVLFSIAFGAMLLSVVLWDQDIWHWIAVGATVFAAGASWWALAAGLRPDYAGDMLGGMLLTGVGVGLTMPTYMATGASSLAPQSFATGSAVLNMLRQVGLAIGVAVLVAVLGTPDGDALAVFQRGWLVIAAASLLAALAGAVLLRPRREPAEPLSAAAADPAA